MKQQHVYELSTLKQNYEKKLQDIRQFHDEDKSFLENLLKNKEEKVKKGAAQYQNYTEMENKYLKDIRDLNDSFDEYKKQVQIHMTQLAKEKSILASRVDELE